MAAMLWLYLIGMAIGLVAWWFMIAVNPLNETMLKRWPLYVIAWPLGLLVLVLWSCKMTYEAVRDIFSS